MMTHLLEPGRRDYLVDAVILDQQDMGSFSLGFPVFVRCG